MKFQRIVIMLLYIGCNLVCYSEQITEIYPGSLINRELIAVHSNPFIVVTFIGTMNGQLAFEFEEFDRRVFEERAIYEKLKVVRQKGDPNDPGLRQHVPGETITGEIEKREEIIKIGPVARKNFHYFGVTSPNHPWRYIS